MFAHFHDFADFDMEECFAPPPLACDKGDTSMPTDMFLIVFLISEVFIPSDCLMQDCK